MPVQPDVHIPLNFIGQQIAPTHKSSKMSVNKLKSIFQNVTLEYTQERASENGTRPHSTNPIWLDRGLEETTWNIPPP